MAMVRASVSPLLFLGALAVAHAVAQTRGPPVCDVGTTCGEDADDDEGMVTSLLQARLGLQTPVASAEAPSEAPKHPTPTQSAASVLQQPCKKTFFHKQGQAPTLQQQSGTSNNPIAQAVLEVEAMSNDSTLVAEAEDVEMAMNGSGVVNTTEEIAVLNAAIAGQTPNQALNNGLLVTSDTMAQLTNGTHYEDNIGCSTCYQGDMVAGSAAQLQLFQQITAGKSPRKNGKWVAAGAPWTNGEVQYCYAADIDSVIRAQFEQAIVQSTSAVGCLNFTNVGNPDGALSTASDLSKNCGGTGMSIFVQSRADEGCWSYVGLLPQGFNGGMQVQPLQLNPNGCDLLGIVIHELGHALGMAHEQSRPDRDQYLTIHWQNIAASAKSNFEMEAGGYAAEVYDYLSIMHYGSTDFSTNGQPTITTPANARDGEIGQRVGYAQTDADQLEAMYNETNSACVASQLAAGAMGCADKDATLCSNLTACSSSDTIDKCCACGGGFQYQCYAGGPCNTPAQIPIESAAACVADQTSLFGGAYPCVTEQQCAYAVKVKCPVAPTIYWTYNPGGCCQLPPGEFGTQVCDGLCTITKVV